MSLLQLRRLTFAYAKEEPVLQEVDLTLAAGETLAITGPSGSGKTTLLNLLALMLRPQAGEIICQGAALNNASPEKIAAYRRDVLGYVFQEHHLLEQCTALENILLPTLANKNQVQSGAIERATMLLAQVDLAAQAAKFPNELSGGERQRVAVCRALINSPRLLLADEPTGALAARQAAALGDLLLQMAAKNNCALLIATHAETLARRCDSVWRLLDGRLCKVAPQPAGGAQNV